MAYKLNTRPLKQHRVEKRMTQGEVADLLGINRVTYSQYEQGTRLPKLDSLLAMADLLDVPLEAMVLKDEVDPLPDALIRLYKKLRNADEETLTAMEDYYGYLQSKKGAAK